MELRPYQQQLYSEIRAELAHGNKSVCAVLGCGGGKSCIEAQIAKSATERGNRVLFIVHRAELCDQIRRTFTGWGVDMNLCDVSMVQTVTRRLDGISPPKLIITDEAHHCLSKTYMRIYKQFPDVMRVGFTATPIRMNEGGLGGVFDALVEGVSTKWLIENHFLAPYKYYAPTLADAEGLKVKRGEYDPTQIANLMENAKIYGDTIENYRKYADGKQTIVYCASVAASMATAEKFNDEGIAAAHLDGETPKQERQATVEAFRRGDIAVLCNVELFGEGFDVPDCEAVILLRPTKSLTLYIQQSMRSMRYKPDKTAIIIDHVRNVYEHGFPDEAREWTLEGKVKGENEVLIKECPVCFAVVPANVKVCPICGTSFYKATDIEDAVKAEAKVNADVSIEDITGMNINTSVYGNYKQCRTFDELNAFRKERGYKFGWTIFKADELGIEIPNKYSIYRQIIKQRRQSVDA